jgi:segregation and condensation protein A
LSNVVPFEEDPPRRDADGNPERLVVDLGGFEGPIDVLLQLARDQKVDITQLSILSLAEQYLAFVRAARRLRLELAADYLVMAAWLAYLKSRLLLPEQESQEAEPSGAEMAAALRFQLQRLQAMQDAGRKLMARPRRGQEVFARGEPMEIPVVDRPVYDCSLYELLQAYARQKVHRAPERLRVDPHELYSVEEALGRLTRLLGVTPAWSTLAAFLPNGLQGGLRRRSAFAATFAASLEMVRDGKADLRQEETFGPIFLRPRAPEAAHDPGRAGADSTEPGDIGDDADGGGRA